MAYDRVVDSSELDADLTAIANAIRSKTGKTDGLTLEQMPGEIEGIEAGGSGGEIFFVPDTGVMYKPHMKYISGGIVGNHNFSPRYSGAPELITFETDLVGNGYFMDQKCFQNCPKLESVTLSRIGKVITPMDMFSNSKNLKKVQYGSVGFPVTALSDGRLLRNSASGLEFTVYVDATTIEEIPGDIKNSAPWGNATAIIIYRDSTTGEVIAE